MACSLILLLLTMAKATSEIVNEVSASAPHIGHLTGKRTVASCIFADTHPNKRLIPESLCHTKYDFRNSEGDRTDIIRSGVDAGAAQSAQHRNAVVQIRLYILDKQARLQNVIVRLADVRLINIFEAMNQQAQIRQNLPVIRMGHFSKYL